MELERLQLKTRTGTIPSLMVTPTAPHGAAVVVHGFGGSKEEVLGLASRIAAVGLTTCAIDLRGHGESDTTLDEGVLGDVDLVVEVLRRWGRVAAVGHSLGGRLALASSADFAIGISPALPREYGATTRKMLAELRAHRVREASPGVNFDLLRSLPEWRPGARPSAVLYASRDVPEIADACRTLAASGAAVTEIAPALHSDVIHLGATFDAVGRQLSAWL
jgi:pimeloyl-ACP methyl ester carboxylesterase